MNVNKKIEWFPILIVAVFVTSVNYGAVHARASANADFFKSFPVPDNNRILQDLLPQNNALESICSLPLQQALPKLMDYLKQDAAKRYYFDWRNFVNRVREFYNAFPQEKQKDLNLAREMMKQFPGTPQWYLPMRDQNGKLVTAYRFRHLARQSKMPAVVLSYYLQNNDKKFLNYFLDQVRSLNIAFRSGKVEQGGNAVYEVFRAGKRIHHWLFGHFAFLASKDYTWRDQLLLLRTFLHHGAILYAETKKYHPGNHQTRGLVALFEIAALFPQFKQTSLWRDHALNLLLQHMENEINSDGFQFERSEHYHKGDIENYLRVYQLAKLNGIALPAEFELKFRSMFSALAKLALPDGNLPVLQDDTDGGSDVEADLTEPMAVGAMLFSDGLFRYFAGDRWPQSYYWLLTNEQLRQFASLPPKAPEYGSLALKKTGYYVMRDGWNRSSNYMLISAGLEKRKPDHQHGDMLGLIGFSHGTMCSPNYKVHYSQPDYAYLKNSWAKNVALVDSQTQGRQWQANRGGSGFGKWKILPEPKVLCWYTGDTVDYFSGTHNGFYNLGVHYYRDVLFVKNHFWLILDQFESSGTHNYQQVWQGKFSVVNNRHLNRELKDGQPLHLVQLHKDGFTVNRHSFGSHQNTVFQILAHGDYDFLTLIFPGELNQKNNITFENKEFLIRQASVWQPSANVKFQIEALVLKRGRPFLLIGVHGLAVNGQRFTFIQPVHFLIVKRSSDRLIMRFFGARLPKGIFKINVPPKCGSVLEIKI